MFLLFVLILLLVSGLNRKKVLTKMNIISKENIINKYNHIRADI